MEIEACSVPVRVRSAAAAVAARAAGTARILLTDAAGWCVSARPTSNRFGHASQEIESIGWQVFPPRGDLEESSPLAAIGVLEREPLGGRSRHSAHAGRLDQPCGPRRAIRSGKGAKRHGRLRKQQPCPGELGGPLS